MANETRLIDVMRIDLDDIDISDCTDVDDIFAKIEDLLDAQPAVDAVEVVRCKGCKYYRPQKISANWEHKKSFCNRVVTVKMPSDGFCSYGERRECNG
jgi:hypothetical protein